MNITDVGHMTDDVAADGRGEDKMQVAAGDSRKTRRAASRAVEANPMIGRSGGILHALSGRRPRLGTERSASIPNRCKRDTFHQ